MKYKISDIYLFEYFKIHNFFRTYVYEVISTSYNTSDGLTLKYFNKSLRYWYWKDGPIITLDEAGINTNIFRI